MDEILEVADDVSQDQLVDSQGKIILNHQAINRARLKIDTRKWLASKLVPKVYGTHPAEEGVDPKMEQEIRERMRKMDEEPQRILKV